MLIILKSVRPNLEIAPAFSNVTISVITLPYPTIDVVYLQNLSSPRVFFAINIFLVMDRPFSGENPVLMTLQLFFLPRCHF